MKTIKALAFAAALSLGPLGAAWLAGPDPHGDGARLPEIAGPPPGASLAAAYATSERAAAARHPGLRQDPRHAGGRLLGYDPRGDGRLIEVFGDLEAARHVAVLVPGSGWDLERALNRRSRGNANPVAGASSLRAELARLAPGVPTAAIAWLGYDAPEAVDRQSARSERAIAGAPQLARFVRGLPGAARVTLVGHSYGTVVAARAVRDFQAPAAQVVMLGSPGVDAGNAAELGVPVWAARDPKDPIGLAPHLRVAGYGHGPDPLGRGFGARVFRTGMTGGHGGYYLPGTESLTNLARLVLGRTGEVTRPR